MGGEEVKEIPKGKIAMAKLLHQWCYYCKCIPDNLLWHTFLVHGERKGAKERNGVRKIVAKDILLKDY